MILDLIIKLIVAGLAVLVSSWLTPGMSVSGYKTAIVVAVVIGILDFALGRIFGEKAAPSGQGAKGFVLAALILFLAGKIVDGFSVGILGALIGALIMGLVDGFLGSKIFPKD
ncbi:hypothetical protein HMPREF9130_1105 [Peptoniphilus sp. oral taxon 375 str. F0436]|uniref:phage holin family protein n=1 Tax=Urinicoccus timonensis TaxID=2024205 RepID=UPI00021A1E39|nr:phage holin family protein [Urinicoccus timonensis]EGS30302.1 hypothetical protein HMPREF9130_1105 [Peptoniphilus sp. oral taxon 375 str. F0436]